MGARARAGGKLDACGGRAQPKLPLVTVLVGRGGGRRGDSGERWSEACAEAQHNALPRRHVEHQHRRQKHDARHARDPARDGKCESTAHRRAEQEERDFRMGGGGAARNEQPRILERGRRRQKAAQAGTLPVAWQVERMDRQPSLTQQLRRVLDGRVERVRAEAVEHDRRAPQRLSARRPPVQHARAAIKHHHRARRGDHPRRRPSSGPLAECGRSSPPPSAKKKNKKNHFLRKKVRPFYISTIVHTTSY
eukprot:scaffold9021_cov35-Tisochrysis_lutea.AAC.4